MGKASVGIHGFMATIRHLITPEDAAVLEVSPEWRPRVIPLGPNIKEDVRDMTDADIEAFAQWTRENDQSACLGMPVTDESVDMFQVSFKCRRCGKCCQGPLLDGITVMPSEVRRISGHLRISETAFMNKYVASKKAFRYGLIAYPCPFREEGEETTCSIYAIRPLACRVFPLDFATFNELAIQSFCPAALDLFIRLTKLRRELLKGTTP